MQDGQTVQLTGPTQSGFASLPSTILYTGTGRRDGTVEVTFRPFPVPPKVRLSGGSGKISLTFHANTGATTR